MADPSSDTPEPTDAVKAGSAKGPSEARKAPYRWTFATSILAVLVLVQIGHLGLIAISEHWRVYQDLRHDAGVLSALAQLPGASMRTVYSEGLTLVRDLSFVAFSISFGLFLRSRWDAVKRFFRSMTVGVSLVGLSTLAIAVGVLVPQIDPVDDARVRVESPDRLGSNYEEHFEQFQFAVGYFLYHLGHLYGVGMPHAQIPEVAASGLDEFGMRYGEEEASNRRKGMQAAFSGREKTDAIYAFATENEQMLRGWFDFATRFNLNRIYRSLWFASLMIVLAIGIATNTFHGGPKRWFTVKKFGFFVVHIGMLTMIAGGGLSRTYTVRGLLHLHEDGLDLNGDGVFQRERSEIPPIEDAFYQSYRSTSDALRYLPFGLSLEHFARRDWPAIEVVFLEDGRPLEFKSRLPSYTLWTGRSIDLDHVETEDGPEPRLRLKVLDLHERANAAGVDARERTEAERGTSSRRPAIALRLPDMAALMTMRELPPQGDWPQVSRFVPAVGTGTVTTPCYVDETGAFRLLAVREGDPAERFPSSVGRLGRCYVRRVAGGVEQDDVIDVRLGEVIDLGDGYRVVFQRATKEYRVDPLSGEEQTPTRPLAEQFPRNPAVFAHLIGPDGTAEDRVLIDRQDPVERGLVADYVFEDLLLSLEWDEWTAPGAERYVLHWDDTGAIELLSESGERTPVEIDGARLPLPGIVPTFLDAVYDDIQVSPRIEFLEPLNRPDGWQEEFYASDPRGLDLEVTLWPEDESRRSTQVVRMATTPNNSASIWIAEDRSFYLRFFENKAGFPFEWRSVLRVHERDANGAWVEVDLGNEYEREIRVNDYFTHRGYRMFQTNANDDLPEYSGIGIVYDPGIPLAMAGMYIVIAGAAFAFLVRPVVLARRKRALATVVSEPAS
jgi:hypothetical protein